MLLFLYIVALFQAIERGDIVLDLTLLRTFLMVAGSKSFSLAAQRLFLSQSTVSKHIGALEKQIGTQLILRTTHNFQLTSAGELLVLEAPELISRADDLEAKVRQANSDGACSISVATETFNDLVLADFFDEFSKNHPDINCTFTHSYFEPILDGLATGTYDIGFIRSSELSSGMLDNNYRALLMTKYEMGLMVSGKHHLACVGSIRLDDMRGETFLFLKHHLSRHHSHFLDAVERAHSHIGADLPTNVEDLHFMIRQNRGIGFADKDSLYCNDSDLHFIHVEDVDLSYYATAIWRRNCSNPSLSILVKELSARYT